MYVIAMLVVLIYIVLFLISRKVDCNGCRKGILGTFDRISKAIIFIFRHFSKKTFTKQRVINALEQLNPGEEVSLLYEKHTVEKLALSLIIVLAGTFIGAGIKFSSSQEMKAFNSKKIERNEYSGDAEYYQVEATIEGQKQLVGLTIFPRDLSESELEEILPIFWEKLGDIVKGENKSLQSVNQNLSTVKKISGYPFKITWTSSNLELISTWNGKVSEVDEECKVFLTAKIKYKSKEYERVYEIVLVPKSIPEEDRLKEELERLLLDEEADTREEKTLNLPEELDEKPIKWRLVVNDISIQIWAVLLLISMVVYFFSDKDVEKEVMKRRELMRKAYPDVVRKLALYIGAGMTLKASFVKICDDAEKHSNNNPIYSEMRFVCREMASGLSEDEAYERLGRRTGSQEYIRLTTLLSQNLKKGSNGLLSRLQEESENAEFERLQVGRRRGEEAGTKLLAPMVLLLLVVMVIIMIPAFSSMGV